SFKQLRQEPQGQLRNTRSMPELIHETLLPVVRHQLEVLSSAVFRWHGLAWPGASLQWEVHEHEQPPHDWGGDSDNSGRASYSTRLKLEMPVLGTLEIRILLSSRNLEMYGWAAT